MNFIVVGGDWNTEGGRPSSYVAQLAVALKESSGSLVRVFNGGNYGELRAILEGNVIQLGDVVVWMANVPNDLPKFRSIKEAHPHSFLVATKRNNGEYSFQELVNRALGMKANLCIDFRTTNHAHIAGRIYDPLGVVWCDYTADISALARVLVGRLREVLSFTRQSTVQIDPTPVPVPEKSHFLEQVRHYADVFHELIDPAAGVTRFLGNSSFRCTRGFPSMRGHEGRIFVSRRNVDKRFIDASAFVAVKRDGDRVLYWGPQKPSVDTPIQLRLYEAFLNINYMMHGHVYVAGAPTTSRAVSCGAVEEVDEILQLLPDRSASYAAVNLLGHGCLIMADTPDPLSALPLIARPAPEYLG